MHVYLSLVGYDHTTKRKYDGLEIIPDPEIASLDLPELYEYFRDGIHSRGGHLAYYEYLHHSETLDELPLEPSSIIKRRLTQYRPHMDPVGRSILKLWKSREKMWNASLQVQCSTS